LARKNLEEDLDCLLEGRMIKNICKDTFKELTEN
jgi:hypothetical protein